MILLHESATGSIFIVSLGKGVCSKIAVFYYFFRRTIAGVFFSGKASHGKHLC